MAICVYFQSLAEYVLNKHVLPKRIINKETGSRCEVSCLELKAKLEVEG